MNDKKKTGKKRGGSRSGAGRKLGSPNKSTQEIKELVGDVVDFKAMIEKYYNHAMRGKPTPTKIAIVKILMEYGHGKPPQQLQITGDLSKEYFDSLRTIADKVMKEAT